MTHYHHILPAAIPGGALPPGETLKSSPPELVDCFVKELAEP